jgi:hypothetical protein
MEKKSIQSEKTSAFAQQVSLFILLVALFLGSLYMFDGNLIIAIPISIILVAIMYYIIWHMVGAKMDKKRSGFSLGNRMLWVLYVMVSIPVTTIVVHAFNVEFKERATIESEALLKTKTLNDLKNEYKNSYGVFLNSRQTEMNYYIPLYINKSLNASDLKAKINVNDVFVSGIDPNNYSAAINSYIDMERFKFERADTSLFGKTDDYIQKQESKIRNFSRLSINFVLNDLDEKLKLSFDELNKYLMVNADGAKLKIDINPYLKPTLITHPIDLLKKQMSISVILVVIFLHLLLLLPYIVAPSRKYDKKAGGDKVVTW